MANIEKPQYAGGNQSVLSEQDTNKMLTPVKPDPSLQQWMKSHQPQFQYGKQHSNMLDNSPYFKYVKKLEDGSEAVVFYSPDAGRAYTDVNKPANLQALMELEKQFKLGPRRSTGVLTEEQMIKVHQNIKDINEGKSVTYITPVNVMEKIASPSITLKPAPGSRESKKKEIKAKEEQQAVQKRKEEKEEANEESIENKIQLPSFMSITPLTPSPWRK